jgi:hypothetical protein
MATGFLEKLKKEYRNSHFEIANDIFNLLSEWKKERYQDGFNDGSNAALLDRQNRNQFNPACDPTGAHTSDGQPLSFDASHMHENMSRGCKTKMLILLRVLLLCLSLFLRMDPSLRSLPACDIFHSSR